MSFTENVLSYTKRIERILSDLGGTGNGMLEKARSLTILSRRQLGDLRRIASVRNKLVHEHDYQFRGNPESFFSLCERVLFELGRYSPRPEARPYTQPENFTAPVENHVTPDASAPFLGSIHSAAEFIRRLKGFRGSIDSAARSIRRLNPFLGSTLSAAAMLIFCRWILAYVFSKEVTSGWWIFKSTEVQTRWGAVWTVSIGVSLATYFVTSRYLSTKVRK